MPLNVAGNRYNDQERQQLVDNEQQPEPDDYVATFSAALPPHQAPSQDFRNVDLHDEDQLLSEAPPDRFHFTYLVFYLLGTATMTPWNFFVTAEDYWLYKFRNTTLNETDIVPDLTPMQKSFTCDLTVTASISGTTLLILNAIYGHRVSLKLKMLGTLTTILLIFIVTCAFVEVNTDRWQEQFFLITLFTVVIMNISSAVMSGGLFGIASLFPSQYMTAVVSGQALGGIFTALAFILVLATGLAPTTTAFIYFIIGSVLIGLSIVTYALMSGRSFFKYHVEGIAAKYAIVHNTPTTSRGAVPDVGVALEPILSVVCGKIYVYAVGICLLFATTLSVYPAVTVLMQSQHYGEGFAWNDIYYMPVVNYLFFNTGDYLGRILAGSWKRPDNPHTAMLMIVLRVLFVPFILCSHTSFHQFLPTLVESDAAFIGMMISFAITNGYLTNILLITGPSACQQHEKELASSIMAASLSCGIALGSILSMVFVQLL